MTEIRAADLRFTFEEATMFLTEVMGLPFSAEQVAALEARTEGWIAGLQLAALSALGSPAERLGKFVDAFTGCSRFVLEYLVEEVLQHQPEDIQHFLLHTSILDRLSGPLCDAVLNKKESHGILEYLVQANLFTFSLDDEQHWLRYHHLFADVLRNRMQHQQPRFVLELHHRASAWYEQHEMVVDAVQHALAASDYDHAARLIEQHAQGDCTKALNMLECALVLAEPAGYIQLSVDEGEPMLNLLSKVLARGHRARSYLQRLLAADNYAGRENALTSLPTSTPIHLNPLQPLLEPLSERELEVLSLMASGASNFEIAEQLVLAISTVKRHVSNIFSKLSANSRTQALAHARRIGLL